MIRIIAEEPRSSGTAVRPHKNIHSVFGVSAGCVSEFDLYVGFSEHFDHRND